MNKSLNGFVGSVSRIDSGYIKRLNADGSVQAECNWFERTFKVGECVSKKEFEAQSQDTESLVRDLGPAPTFSHTSLTDYQAPKVGVQVSLDSPEPKQLVEEGKEIEIPLKEKAGQVVLLMIVSAAFAGIVVYLISKRTSKS